MADEEKIESQEEVQVSDPAADSPDAAADAAGDPAAHIPDGDAAADQFDRVINAGDASEDDAEAAMLAMLQDLPQDDSKASPDDIDFGGTEVANAEFQHLSEPAAKPQPRNIDLLMDVNLPISIELGRTRMSISDILGLGPGSVVELNKLAGEPVDVMVNHKIVAKGEVVVIDENFGVRITQLMTPEERLKLLSDEE